MEGPFGADGQSALLEDTVSNAPHQDTSMIDPLLQTTSYTSVDSINTQKSRHISASISEGYAIPSLKSHASMSDGPSPKHFRANSIDSTDRHSPMSIFGGDNRGRQNSHDGTNASGGSEIASKARSKERTNTEDKDADSAPAWADLKTKAGKDRKRLPLACITCRRKKIRCSGEKPACKHCLRSRIPCVYKVTTRKAAPRTDYMAMLDKRLKRMEERVIKIMPKDEQRNVDVIGRAVVKPALLSATATKPDSKKRPATKAFGDDLENWASTKPGATGLSNKEDQPVDDLMTEGAEFLPSKELQQHLSEVYFDFVYGQSYHLLHKPSYLRKLEAGQLPPVIILAVCAIAARFSSHPELRTEPVFLRGEKWARPARTIALKRYDTPNIAVLICYLLLGLHEFGTCQGGRSWMLGGMAQRMAYALQLHKDLDPTAARESEDQSDLSFTDREIRRRTMWACFMMDRFNSSGTDRPMFVAESYIEAQLPIREHFFQTEITGHTEHLDAPASIDIEPHSGQITDPKENMGVAAYMIRAVCVWGQVVRYVNLGGREQDVQPMWSPDSGFARIKKLYDKFRENLPENLHWNEDNLQAHVGERIANQFIFMHIIINQVNLFLNRFALPVLGSRSTTQTGMPEEFLSDCARNALDAAGQISVLANEAHDHRVVAPFAGYCAFLSSTVHIQGLSSQNPAVEAASKQYLAWNVKYLSNMKKYWGMFHFVTEHLKDLYRKQMDASLRAQQGQATPAIARTQEGVFQYGDWFDRYPHGVSGTDYEDAGPEIKKEASDAMFGQKPDLQSVEDFFAKMSPPSKTAPARKVAKRKQSKAAIQSAAATKAESENAPAPQTSIAEVMQQPAQAQSKQPVQQHPQNLHMPQLSGSGFSGQGLPDQNFYRQQIAQQQQNFARGTLGPDFNILQQLAHPGVMSQMDRQMVLSSYLGMGGSGRSTPLPNSSMGGMNLGFGVDMSGSTSNPGFAFNHTSTGNAAGANPQQPQQQQQQQQQLGGAHATGNPAQDSMLGLDPWTDPSSLSWFMPFNVDPPSGMGDEADLFGGAGDFDFGTFGGPSAGGGGVFGLEGLDVGDVVDAMGGVEQTGQGQGQGQTQGQGR